MCGIFGYIGHQNAANIVFDGLKMLEYRGYDSWGISVQKSEKIFTLKKSGKIGQENINKLPYGYTAIGHTRWATHGGATNINAHPHLDCNKNITVIHNGIFENYQKFKNKLIKYGHNLISQTDTEVVPHMIEDFLKNSSLENSVKKTFNKMNGLNALLVMSATDNKIVAVKNGSPLVVGFGKNENFIASDPSALTPYTKDIYYLEDNDMAIIESNKIKIIDAKSGTTKTPKKQKISWSVSQTLKDGFPDFMSKEIYEQPKIIKNLLLSDRKEISKLAEVIKSSNNVYAVGCGSAFFAALVGQYIFSEISDKFVASFTASEFKHQLKFINKKSLVLFISQSGETMDILECVKAVKKTGATISCLTNVVGSSLFTMSDHRVTLNTGPEIAVASTKALTAMITNLMLLAYKSGGEKFNKELIANKVFKSISKLLSKESVNEIKDLAWTVRKNKDIFVIGRGISYPTSLETALKIKEISYIHAEGIAAGELKHGAIALIKKGFPCIAFLPNDNTYQESLNTAIELKARGAKIIGVSYKNSAIFDHYVNVVDTGVRTILPNIIFGQIFAYYLAKTKKLDPDKPRNLAKSVTVK